MSRFTSRPGATSRPWLAGALVMTTALAACSGASQADPDEAGGAPTEGGELVFALDSSPDNLDPNSSSSAVNATVMRQVFDSLVWRTPEGELQPWLATSWEVSEDNTTYTLQLRDDVTFHDGTPFDAEAVCVNFDRITDPATQSKSAISTLGDSYESCEASAEHEVVLTLSEPTFQWLGGLSQVWAGIQSPAAIEEYGADVVTHPVGTGPFMFDSMQLNQQVVLQANEDYAWAPEELGVDGPPLLDTLVLKVIPESTTRFRSVGVDIDAAESIAPQDAKAAEANTDLTVTSTAVVGTPYQLFINTSHEPWDDVEARRALRSAMNIDAIIETLYFGVFERAWGPLTPTTLFYDPAVEGSSSYDLEASMAAFEQLGWTVGDDGYRYKDGEILEVDYLVPSAKREKRQEVAQFLQENLREAGVKVNLQFEASGPYDAKRDANEYDLMGLSLTSGFSTLNAIYDSRNAPGAGGQSYYNYARLDSPEVDELLSRAEQATTDEEAADAYAQVQEFVVENAVSVPVYNFSYTVVASTDVDGIAYNWKSYPVFVGASVSD